MFGNQFIHKEIGNYTNDLYNTNYSKENLTDIIKQIGIYFHSINASDKNIKKKEVFDTYNIYYILKPSYIFYAAALTKDFESEDDIFYLFEDIENQGIKKLTDSNGELSRIGKQNLCFCIEQSHTHELKDKFPSLNLYENQNNNSDNSNTFSLLSSNNSNELQNAGKEDMKKLLNSNDDNEKNHQRFNDDINTGNNKDDTLYKKLKCRKYTIIACISFLIVFIILFIIFKK